MMIKCYLMLLFVLASLLAKADDYKRLVFTTADGQTVSVAAEGLEMTIVDGQLRVSDGTSIYVLPLSTLASMAFSTDEANAIRTLAEADADAPVTVFTAAGQRAGTFASLSEARSRLPRGLYIIQSRITTSKLLVR